MTATHNGKYVSGKSRRRIEISQRMKKRFIKGGYMVINELKIMDRWLKAIYLHDIREARRNDQWP